MMWNEQKVSHSLLRSATRRDFRRLKAPELTVRLLVKKRKQEAKRVYVNAPETTEEGIRFADEVQERFGGGRTGAVEDCAT